MNTRRDGTFQRRSHFESGCRWELCLSFRGDISLNVSDADNRNATSGDTAWGGSSMVVASVFAPHTNSNTALELLLACGTQTRATTIAELSQAVSPQVALLLAASEPLEKISPRQLRHVPAGDGLEVTPPLEGPISTGPNAHAVLINWYDDVTR